MSWLDTITRPGLTTWSASNPIPNLSIVPVELFSITRSERAASWCRSTRPSGDLAFTPNPSFERLDDANDGFVSPPSCRRMKSVYVRDSIFMTSAPYSANRRPTSTPTAPWPKSMTRSPASGGPPTGAAADASRRSPSAAKTSSVCWPTAGGGVVGPARWPSISK